MPRRGGSTNAARFSITFEVDVDPRDVTGDPRDVIVSVARDAFFEFQANRKVYGGRDTLDAAEGYVERTTNLDVEDPRGAKKVQEVLNRAVVAHLLHTATFSADALRIYEEADDNE